MLKFDRRGRGAWASFSRAGPRCVGGDYPFARQQDCDLRLFDFEAFGGFGKEVRSTLIPEGGGEPAEQQTFARSAPGRGHMDHQELARAADAALVCRSPHRRGVADGERASVRGQRHCARS